MNFQRSAYLISSRKFVKIREGKEEDVYSEGFSRITYNLHLEHLMVENIKTAMACAYPQPLTLERQLRAMPAKFAEDTDAALNLIVNPWRGRTLNDYLEKYFRAGISGVSLRKLVEIMYGVVSRETLEELFANDSVFLRERFLEEPAADFLKGRYYRFKDDFAALIETAETDKAAKMSFFVCAAQRTGKNYNYLRKNLTAWREIFLCLYLMKGRRRPVQS